MPRFPAFPLNAISHWGFRGRYCASQSLSNQSVHTNVPALRDDNAQEEEEQEHAGAYPAVGCVRGRGIEVGLVFLMQMA
jgi:hypothetical protein